jgi:hypothetical protein
MFLHPRFNLDFGFRRNDGSKQLFDFKSHFCEACFGLEPGAGIRKFYLNFLRSYAFFYKKQEGINPATIFIQALFKAFSTMASASWTWMVPALFSLSLRASQRVMSSSTLAMMRCCSVSGGRGSRISKKKSFGTRC